MFLSRPLSSFWPPFAQCSPGASCTLRTNASLPSAPAPPWAPFEPSLPFAPLHTYEVLETSSPSSLPLPLLSSPSESFLPPFAQFLPAASSVLATSPRGSVLRLQV